MNDSRMARMAESRSSLPTREPMVVDSFSGSLMAGRPGTSSRALTRLCTTCWGSRPTPGSVPAMRTASGPAGSACRSPTKPSRAATADASMGPSKFSVADRRVRFASASSTTSSPAAKSGRSMPDRACLSAVS